MNIAVGYDTSCYTTSVAAVDENQNIIANFRKLLAVKNGERGLRQSEAVFKHLQQIDELNKELFEVINRNRYKIIATSASVKPRDADESYMPVFIVGQRFAQQLALSQNCLFYESNHQIGHIYAAKYNSQLNNNIYLGFHISGGTTELLLVDNASVSIIGRSLDISMGQLIDRIGVMLGLPFPSGKYLEKLASNYVGDEIPKFTTTVRNGNCNLSGTETQAKNCIDEFSKESIAFALFNTIANCITKMIIKANNDTKVDQILFFGGVSSSNLLRSLLLDKLNKNNKKIKLFFGNNELCSDNAVGIALRAMEDYKNNEQNH